MDIILEHTIFKEAADLLKAMWRKVLDVRVVTVFRVISANCYDLIIFLSLAIVINDVRTQP
jgi:predicted metal-dependent hydrolase